MGEYHSFYLHVWTDPDNGTKHWELRHVQTQQELSIQDASFIIRIWADPSNHTFRASLRHAESGEQLEFQSSERLVDFIGGYIQNPAEPKNKVLSDFMAALGGHAG